VDGKKMSGKSDKNGKMSMVVVSGSDQQLPHATAKQPKAAVRKQKLVFCKLYFK
jgi:hypothetical protein